MNFSYLGELHDQLGGEHYYERIIKPQKDVVRLRRLDHEIKSVQMCISALAGAVSAAIVYCLTHQEMGLETAVRSQLSIIAGAYMIQKGMDSSRSDCAEAIESHRQAVSEIIPDHMGLLRDAILRDLGMGDAIGNMDYESHCDGIQGMLRGVIERFAPFLGSLL